MLIELLRLKERKKHHRIETTYSVVLLLIGWGCRFQTEVNYFKDTDWVFHTGRICHVWFQLLTWLHVSDYHIFGTVKDSSLKINSLPLNNCFSYRNVLQNGVNSLSKKVLKNSGFCSKALNCVHFGPYDLVQTSLECSSNTYQIMWSNNTWRDFWPPVSAFVTVARKNLNDKFTAKRFLEQTFYVTITDANIGSLKSLHTLLHK